MSAQFYITNDTLLQDPITNDILPQSTRIANILCYIANILCHNKRTTATINLIAKPLGYTHT
jgi:hypothetical protein